MFISTIIFYNVLYKFCGPQLGLGVIPSARRVECKQREELRNKYITSQESLCGLGLLGEAIQNLIGYGMFRAEIPDRADGSTQDIAITGAK
uniref:Uncharacterized protein n=1 Tax=Moniliophthora roreri TaxID=221103 RepID=A0A0W0G379_MONRR